MLIGRVAAFVRGESGESFEELALAIFRLQYQQNAPFRELCDLRQATPGTVSDWRDVPAIPASALDSSETGDSELTPDHALLDLRRAVIDHSFAATCLQGMERPPVLSLIPAGGDPTALGLDFLAQHVLRAWAAPDSRVAWARRGVETAKARSFLAARQRDRRPTLVLATSATLGQLLEALDRRGLRFRLPPGSRVVTAGDRGPLSRELLSQLAEGLAVPPDCVVREYCADGPASRFYASHSQQGEPRPFRPLPWTRVRILDSRTLAEMPPGATGSIALFDLAGLGPVAHQLTGDTGVADEHGFRLA
jgi:hypothetical protein